MANKRIAIKIGSNVLTLSNGLPNLLLLESLTRQMAELKKKGLQIVLISSGAVAAGRSILPATKRLDTVAERQLLSSLGQVRLIQIYTDLFKAHDLLCSQVLVTKQDFRDRQHYLNMQNCLEALLQNNIIPVVNENDVVSVTELMFTDNDELAGLISAMLSVEAMYILTNVDGIYNGDPNDRQSKIIEVFDRDYHITGKIASGGKSHFGRGGILTKCHTAQKVASMGIPVTIANGLTPDIISCLYQGEKAGTFFPPKKATSGVKKWPEFMAREGQLFSTYRQQSLLPAPGRKS